MKTRIHRHCFLWKPVVMATLIVSTTAFSQGYAINNDLKNGKSNVEELTELSLEELMEVRVVTIATGAKQTTIQASAVTTVITAEDIQAMGSNELSEVLQSVPGVYVRRSGTFYQATYAIRGISTGFNPEVLMMINSIPLNQLVIGGSRRPIWDAPRLHDIARIEIIRGPGSAVYGADAYSGVINIITKNAKDIAGTEVGGRVGSFDSREAWLLHGGNYQGVDVSLSVQAYHTAGPRLELTADAQTPYDQLMGGHFSATPGSMNLQRDSLDVRTEIGKGHWLLRAGYLGRYNVGRGLSSTLDPFGLSGDDRYNIDLTWHNPQLTEHWDVSTQVSYRTMKEMPETDFLNGLPGVTRRQADGSIAVYPYGRIFNIGFAERHSRAEFSAFYSGWSNHLIRIGAGYHYADNYFNLTQTNLGINPYTGQPIPPDSRPVDVSGTARAINPPATRGNWHVYLQDSWKLASGWELTAGVRHDDYSDFGGTTNPRLALVKQFSDDLAVKLLYGKAFRAPSSGELTTANNSSIVGSADLKAEKIETWELATEWQMQSQLRLAANLFYYEATDKIEYVAVTSTSGGANQAAQNIGIQRGQGVELETVWQVRPSLNLSAHYAYQNSKDKIKDQDMGYTPHHKIYLRGDWLFANHWHLHPQVLWIGERNHAIGDTRPPVDSYTKVDLTLRYKPSKQTPWNFSIGVQDLFDSDALDVASPSKVLGQYEVPNEIPIYGRQFFMEMGYRF